MKKHKHKQKIVKNKFSTIREISELTAPIKRKKYKKRKQKYVSTFKEASQIIDIKEHENLRNVEDLRELRLEKNEKLLHDDFETELSSNEPIRELLSSRNVRFKTEVTEEQRSALSILYHAYEQCEKRGIEFEALKSLLDDFVDFGVSLDRKSRQEYVEAHKAQLSAMEAAKQQQGQQHNMENMKI